MAEIYEAAKEGNLTQADLDGKSSKEIDWINKSRLSPLGIAVWRGHAKTVKLLLDNKASPNIPKDEHEITEVKHVRPPLWVAAAKTTKNPPYIVRLLLERGADPNLRSPVDDYSSPLEEAVHCGDFLDVIRLLVDAGAKPDERWVEYKKTAREIAKRKNNPDLLQALLPEAERARTKLDTVGLIICLLLGIIFLVNTKSMYKVGSGTTAAALGGYVARNRIKEYFNMSGVFEERIPEEIQKKKDEEEFRTSMNNFIKEKHFDRFFPRESDFLSKVVDGAVRLHRDPDNTANTGDLTRLALYQTVLYCDDTGSMKTDNRIESLRGIVKRIANITTKIIPDDGGIELRFINADVTKAMSRPSLEGIDRIIQEAPLGGPTCIGTNLKKKVLDDLVLGPVRRQQLNRPVLVSIITDGWPTIESRDELKNTILACKEELKRYRYKEDVVCFQISQIGNEKYATDFLESLKADLTPDTLYRTSGCLDEEFNELEENDSKLEAWVCYSTLMSNFFAIL
ncbi:hypothetical protein AARAC_011038 [Aspergillus arachidicola]|uniref:Uncharacterized protein n=1 Tax=Aspergillus arachidicola TaxID=656916 RepID=A0A2G7G8Y4_9EURO|nr:hypothetical protein AARAC_011038 [Aspergillus arachidicola]